MRQKRRRVKLALDVAVFHDHHVARSEDVGLVMLVGHLSACAEMARDAGFSRGAVLEQDRQESPTHDLGYTSELHVLVLCDLPELVRSGADIQEVQISQDDVIHLRCGLRVELALSLAGGLASGDAGRERGGDFVPRVAIGYDGGADGGSGGYGGKWFGERRFCPNVVLSHY
jgi:hypothetical protein